jgi:hypothetical protein
MQTIILIGIGLAVLYLGALYAAPGTDKSAPGPASSLGRVPILRNLFISILIVFSLDAAIFHSGLYESILKRESYAGQVWRVVQWEKQRKSSGRKEIFLLGDSQLQAAFSEEIANKSAAGRRVTFIRRVVWGSSPRIWYYILREIDPLAQRYRAIVIPNQFDMAAMRQSDRLDIMAVAPLLRYSDAFSFASSFQEWKNKCRAFVVCLLRGSAFQSDLFDLLEKPGERMTRLRKTAQNVMPGQQTPPLDDVVGFIYDPTTNKVNFPKRFSQRQRTSFQRYIELINRSNASPKNDYIWTKRILQRYANSSTAIVIARMPRTPLLSLVPPTKQGQDEEDKTYLRKRAMVLDEGEFEFLEVPEYFSDATHLNRKGERLFTERLTNELLSRLEPVEASKDQLSPSG